MKKLIFGDVETASKAALNDEILPYEVVFVMDEKSIKGYLVNTDKTISKVVEI